MIIHMIIKVSVEEFKILLIIIFMKRSLRKSLKTRTIFSFLFFAFNYFVFVAICDKWMNREWMMILCGTNTRSDHLQCDLSKKTPTPKWPLSIFCSPHRPINQATPKTSYCRTLELWWCITFPPLLSRCLLGCPIKAFQLELKYKLLLFSSWPQGSV